MYSVEKQIIIYEFNFYKKKFKKIKKNLNFVIEKNTVYISDNIGYLYALNYETQKIIWAKNFRTPFRSNIKISGDLIILADQNNFLYFINKNSLLMLIVSSGQFKYVFPSGLMYLYCIL